MDTFQPEKAIVPIVIASEHDPIQEILGTGCFIGTSNNLHILTAKHIFELGERDEFAKYAFLFNSGKRVEIWAISEIVASKDYDIAICKIAPIEGAIPLQFAKQQPALNADVYCYEYSQISIERKRGGGKHIKIEPFAHKGNIMRYIESEYPEKVKTQCFNTSFPALQGASGAPVIAHTQNKNFYIAGIMVANQETHLMPAQVVKIEDGESYIEETSYFLPTGKGINSSLIIQVIEELGVEIEYVDSNVSLICKAKTFLLKLLNC
ncbi:hypothetical protein BMS3Abin11_00930 [bacterium BMS3Abin11]|nr:hypothetical protein BMS3Abin11_00930 [bacterium BMS3Abin11]HDZ77782.1 hypothetical protein [Gammaproteobacteria bacterium]